jgi:hypothetical protein
MSALVLVPPLEQLLADPSLARTLPRPACIEARRQAQHFLAELDARLAELDPAIVEPAVAADDRKVDAKRAAEPLGLAAITLLRLVSRGVEPYRGFVVDYIGRSPRFSWLRIQEYLKTAGLGTPQIPGRGPRIGRRSS